MADVARILSSRPLRYREGADLALDRPAHVRAASGLAWAGTVDGPRLVVCQDDASFIGLLEPVSAVVTARTLPPGPGGFRQFGTDRSNKMDKLDLESACVVDSARGPRAWLWGSGSAPVREVLVEIDVTRPSGAVRVVSLAPLYAALRAHPALIGAEINVEGACALGSDFVLLQRGNGQGGVNAVVRISAAEVHALVEGARGWFASLRVDPVTLPSAGGVPLTFTDAEPHGVRLLFLAAAEASPNVIDDGEVVGCGIGLLDLSGAPRVDAWATLVERDGTPSVRKPEGIALDQKRGGIAWVVVDMDDPSTPSELCEVELPAAFSSLS